MIFAALSAGIATSLMPCALSGIPILINCIGPDVRRLRALGMSVVFSLGASAVYALLGTVFSFADAAFAESPIWHILLGAFLILMAFETWGIICIIPHKLFKGKSSCPGMFAAGIVSGIISAPCSAAALAVLLSAHSHRSAFAVLLFCIGHSLLSVAAGISSSFARRLTQKHGAAANALRIILGCAVFGFGVYMIIHAFVH